MVKVTYNKQLTALVVIDPYNDFISEGGKIWDRLKAVAEANQCVPNMLRVPNAARKAELRVFYALHRRYRPGDYETWKYSTAEAAKRIGVHLVTLHKWIAAKKIRPSIGVPIGAGRTLWKWTDADIARGRKIKAQGRPRPKSKKSS